MMTLEALLELIRTRKLCYVAFYDDETGGCVMHTYEPIEVHLVNELAEALREHKTWVWYYLFTNDINVCIDPANHEQYYVQAERLHEEEYTRCTECARIRSEAMLSRKEWALRQTDGSSLDLTNIKPRQGT